jgi:hypothetical protein
MEYLEIAIINPKAKKLIDELVSLNLIKITEKGDKKKEFKKLINKFRSVKGKKPTLDEITKEVETVRKKRYAAKKD